MQNTSSSSASSTSVVTVPWLIIFVVIKVWGTAFAAWSWWWCFFPVVPDVYLLLQKLGVI